MLILCSSESMPFVYVMIIEKFMGFVVIKFSTSRLTSKAQGLLDLQSFGALES